MGRADRVFALCIWVAFASGCKQAESPTSPTPSPTSDVFYTALAASDGIGVGASVPCIVFDPDCPNGTGYVYQLKRRLQAAGRAVTLRNLSVPGAVLSPAIQELSRDVGRDVLSTLFDQTTVVPWSSTHVTVFAGGNDTNVIGQNVRAGRGSADVRAFVDAQVRQFGADYEELVRRVRARAPNARVVLLNLPNLGAAPYVATAPLQERSVLQRIAVGITDRINALAGANVLVVDLMCEPRVYDPAAFSSDGFHPSDRGYTVIAELAYPALTGGATPTPSSSCPQRTLLPVF